MGIEFKSSFDPNKLKDEILEKQKQKLGEAITDAAAEIVVRSRAGQDAKGSAFKPLTPEYKKFKVLKGRSENPDLTFTGTMLASISSKIEQVGNTLVGKIFFTSSSEATKAAANMKIRKFFELSAQQIIKIKNKLQGN